MKITLYNAISQDGFVATKDRKEDFIPNELWNSFIEICNQNNVLIWGKNTYDAFKEYDQQLINQFIELPIRKVILSRDTNLIPDPYFTIVHSVKEVCDLGEENILVSGSAVLNDLFVNKKLVDEVIINVLPIKIGDGIPQFIVKPELILVSEKLYPKWIQRIYKTSR